MVSHPYVRPKFFSLRSIHAIFRYAERRPFSIGAFARRLMHFCSAEVAAQASRPTVSFDDLPSSSKEPIFPHGPLSTSQDVSGDTIEDLVDGLDVLLVLERAYERALKSHVITPSAQASTPSFTCAVQARATPDWILNRPPSGA